MAYFDNIAHNVVYKQKIQVNKDGSHKRLLILNNIDESRDVLKLLKDDRRFDRLLIAYKQFYMDFRFKGKYLTRSFNLNLLEERSEAYKYVKANHYLLPVKTFDLIKRYGIVDNVFVNSNFLKLTKQVRYPIKVGAYLAEIKKMMNIPRYELFQKEMIVDINEWLTYSGGDVVDTPMGYIIFAMRKLFESYKALGNMNIIFIGSHGIVRLNPYESDENAFLKFKRNLLRIHPALGVKLEDEGFDKQIETREFINASVDHLTEKLTKNLVGDTKLVDKVREKVEDTIEAQDGDAEKINTIVDEGDTTLYKDVMLLVNKETGGKSVSSNKRDQLLREKQMQVMVDNMSVEDIVKRINNEKPTITTNDVSDKVMTLNKNVTKVKFANFDKEYNEKLLKADIASMVLNLNNYTIPVMVRDIKIEDSSDALNYKETWTCQLEDSNRVRHTLKFDIPKFIDPKTMYIGGNGKQINYQMTNKPVVKTHPAKVQVCSASYNKIFIERKGDKFSEELEQIRTYLSTSPSGTKVVLGSSVKDNLGHLTFIEYDELAKSFVSMKKGATEIIFSQVLIKEMLDKKYPKYKKKYETSIIVGFNANGPIEICLDPSNDQTDDFLEEVIIKGLLNGTEEVREALGETKTGKKFAISQAMVMGKNVPLVFILMYLEGLTTVMDKAGIKYSFSETRPTKLDKKMKYLSLKDGYLIYDISNTSNNFLMNAFYNIPTKSYTLDEWNGKEPYLDIFERTHGQRSVGMAFVNYYNSMICPLTKETLEKFNYPTKFVELMLFANSLLSDSQYSHETEMECYAKIRSNEVIPAVVHKAISTAYAKYLATASNNNPKKISMPRDTVIKELMSLTTVEDKSRLGPIYELDKVRTVSPKGFVGMNLDESYTMDKRCMTKSMLGLIAMSTPTDANVGKTRILTMEPNISSTRGYFDIKSNDLDSLKDANLFSPGEMLTPVGAQKDDATRTAMSAAKQSKHIVPTLKSSPVLISNGAEQVVQYQLSDDYSIVAEDDGQVIEMNTETNIMVLKYKNGRFKAIDMGTRTAKNGAGGFWVDSRYQTNYKLGQKFKKNDIIATDDKFFKDDLFGNRMTLGSLQYIGIFSSDSTIEDSTEVSESLCEDMTSCITMEETISIGKNSNLLYIAKEGDFVQEGDRLCQFEESFDDSAFTSLLSSIDDDTKESIASLGRRPISSHYTGEIVSVEVYPASELDELSPSLKKFVKGKFDTVKKIHKQLDKYRNPEEGDNPLVKAGLVVNKASEKLETKFGVLKGEKIEDGVVISIKIRVRDKIGVGDKITFYGPLKTTVGNIIPLGQEPHTVRRPDKKITAMVAANSVNKRMVQPSILSTTAANKVIVELGDKLRELYES